MPKAQNLIRTERLTISTTPHVLSLLGRLVKSGLYGKNHAEAAERLISKALESLIIDDLFSKIVAESDSSALRKKPRKTQP
jgi:hypothetical protein